MSWALAVQEGAVNLIFVAVFSANGALTVLGPNLTEVALPRLVPVISITVPAAVGPWVGVIEVTAGAVTQDRKSVGEGEGAAPGGMGMMYGKRGGQGAAASWVCGA